MSIFVFFMGEQRQVTVKVGGNDEKKERELRFNERVEGRRWELSLC